MTRIQKQPTEGKKILASYVFDKQVTHEHINNLNKNQH